MGVTLTREDVRGGRTAQMGGGRSRGGNQGQQGGRQQQNGGVAVATRRQSRQTRQGQQQNQQGQQTQTPSGQNTGRTQQNQRQGRQTQLSQAQQILLTTAAEILAGLAADTDLTGASSAEWNTLCDQSMLGASILLSRVQGFGPNVTPSQVRDRLSQGRTSQGRRS